MLTAREPFYRVGGNFTFNYHCCLQFNGLYMYGHDYNLLPDGLDGRIDPACRRARATPVGFIHGSPSTFSGGFVDAEWLAYPWMYVMIRYDGVNSQSDYQTPWCLADSPIAIQRRRQRDSQSHHAGSAVPDSRQHQGCCRVPIPAVAIGDLAMNPITGLPMAINSFHTNTLVLGFEFAY